MNNQNGYGLIIVSVFMTLLGLSSNLYMIKAQQKSRDKRTSNIYRAVNEQASLVKSLITSWNECTYNLQGQRIGEDLQVHPRDLANRRIIKSMGGREILWPQQLLANTSDDIQIERISVENLPHKVTGNIEPHLNVIFNLNAQNKPNLFVLKNIVRTFRLKIRRNSIDNQVIEGCFHEENNFIENNIVSRCLETPGATFDQDSFACIRPTPNPEVSANDWVNCGFDVIRIEKDIDGNFNVVCGEGSL